MSRRGRALVFVVLAVATAAVAAGIANSYGSSVAQGYGPLRPVVVMKADIDGGQRIDASLAAAKLTTRRVPERFVPSGSLAFPEEAIGLVAEANLPAGSYLLAAQLHPPRPNGSGAPGLGHDRRPVEISVSGAGALLTTGSAPVGARVDVVVTSEPSGSGRGHTYVAAAGVPLLALRPESEGPGSEVAAATLGLTRTQALRLIAAESFARKITLLLVR